jgi:hypothetical protein
MSAANPAGHGARFFFPVTLCLGYDGNQSRPARRIGAMRRLAILLLVACAANPQAGYAHDDFDPYYPNRKSPKLITPQWVGEHSVEVVVILAVDDMKDPKKYEAFLRPILRRLQKIDGRAPVSIMSCSVDPADPQLQSWLKEGLSIECHTFDHPCPFFKGGFDKAKETYDKCVDLMHAIPDTKPVAFRMPCCDSLNTPSPRFWEEIFNKTTAKGNFLTIDSSVFNVFTSDDPALPKELVRDEKGGERFKKYLPADRSFVNTIENYPYPYVIGKLCWEFPCTTPSDWQAQHLHKPCNPQTVADWKAALDCTVIKRGVFCLVFHPHGWIKNDQVVEFIDHAVEKHGKKVKFLTFKEAQGRLNKNLFYGGDLRTGRTSEATQEGKPSIMAALAYENGYARVLVFKRRGPTTHVTEKTWVMQNGTGSWNVKNRRMQALEPVQELGSANDKATRRASAFLPVPGFGELFLLSKGTSTKIVGFKGGEGKPIHLDFTLPQGACLRDENSKDAGLRFVDLDGDGNPDIIFSNEKEYGIYLFKDMKEGWSRKVIAGTAGDKDALPMISRNGTNNGFWVHSGHLWWSNEDTVLLKDHVDRRSIKELLERASK